MSTKIFNGYKINLEEGETLFTFVKKVRAALDPVYMDKYGWLMGGRACCFADAWLRGEEMVLPGPYGKDHGGKLRRVGPHPLIDTMMVLEAYKKELDASGERYPQMDLSCEVAFVEDPATKDTYALLYTEHGEFTAVFEALVEVEEYGYWNNTDPPEHMTQSEWQTRSETWERVLPGYETPSRLGLCWSMLGSTHHASLHYMKHREELMPYMLGVHERARVIARRAALAQLDAKREVAPGDVYETIKTMQAEQPECDRITEELVGEIEPTLEEFGVDSLVVLTREPVA